MITLKMMNKKLLIYTLTALLSSLFIFGCSRALVENELRFGIEAAQKDLWDEAIFRWQKAALAQPQSASVHNNLAVAYEKKGLWEKAKKEYELALKLDPDNAYIQSNYQNFKRNYELTKENSTNEKK